MTSVLIRVRHFGTRAIACVLLAAPITSCTTWRPIALPTPLSDTAAPTYWTSRARIILTRGDTLMLTRVLIARDSVVGTGVDGRERRFARRDVATMDRRQIGAARTVALTVVGTMLAFTLLLLATAALLSLE